MVTGALIHAAREPRRAAALNADLRRTGFWPAVTILVPAHNEGPVIGPALASALATRYPRFEIIVIDDGSSDETARIVAAVSRADPRVRLIIHPVNRGKAAALNTGLRAARHDLIVTMDADTWLSPRTVRYLALNLLSRRISGVTANLRIGNQNRALTLWQQIEYVTAIHVERRTLSSFHCVTTLAGACSAFRRQAILSVGGFPSGTLAEDTDATLAMLRAGHRISFEPRALALTEAPTSLRDLYRQRFRWLFGNFQCVARHGLAALTSPNAALKWLGFPNLVLSGILLMLFFPFFIAGTIHALLSGMPAAVLLLPGYFAADLIASALGVFVARERAGLLLHALPQRVFYAFFMTWVFLRVVWAALRRDRPGWGTIRRVGMGD